MTLSNEVRNGVIMLSREPVLGNVVRSTIRWGDRGIEVDRENEGKVALPVKKWMMECACGTAGRRRAFTHDAIRRDYRVEVAR